MAAGGDLDLSTATMTVFTETGALAAAPCNLATPGCSTFQVPPGSQPRVQIRVSRFGSISGTVVGVTDPAPNSPQTPLPIGPPPAGSTVTATRVAFDDTSCVLSNPGPTVQAVAVGNGYRISGPPGYYRIDASNPNYDPIVGESPPTTGADQCLFGGFFPTSFGPQVYKIANDTTTHVAALAAAREAQHGHRDRAPGPAEHPGERRR